MSKIRSFRNPRLSPKHSLHPHHRLDMMRMRKHIDGSDIGNTIRAQVEESSKIAGECRGIAADVDDDARAESENRLNGIGMQSVSRRIDDQRVGCLPGFLKCL